MDRRLQRPKKFCAAIRLNTAASTHRQKRPTGRRSASTAPSYAVKRRISLHPPDSGDNLGAFKTVFSGCRRDASATNINYRGRTPLCPSLPERPSITDTSDLELLDRFSDLDFPPEAQRNSQMIKVYRGSCSSEIIPWHSEACLWPLWTRWTVSEGRAARAVCWRWLVSQVTKAEIFRRNDERMKHGYS